MPRNVRRHPSDTSSVPLAPRTRNSGQAGMRADGEDLHPQLGYWISEISRTTFANVFPVNQGGLGKASARCVTVRLT